MGNYKLVNGNKEFMRWLKTNPRYTGLSSNKAMFRLYKDHSTGRYVDSVSVRQGLEEMIYGKKKSKKRIQ